MYLLYFIEINNSNCCFYHVKSTFSTLTQGFVIGKNKNNFHLDAVIHYRCVITE